MPGDNPPATWAWARAWARVCAVLVLVLGIGPPAAGAAGADLRSLFLRSNKLTGADHGRSVDQPGSNFKDHNLTGAGKRSKAKRSQRSEAKKSIKTRVWAKNADARGRAGARARGRGAMTGIRDISCRTGIPHRVPHRKFPHRVPHRITMKNSGTRCRTGLELKMEESKRLEKQEQISELADEYFDQAIASGEPFSEALSDWAVNKALQEIGGLK
jgi:hypothetical protein